MPWSDIAALIIMLVLLSECFVLMHKNKVLRKENTRLLEKHNGYGDLKDEAKDLLETSTEMKAIKTLRERHGLSLVDANNIVKSVK